MKHYKKVICLLLVFAVVFIPSCVDATGGNAPFYKKTPFDYGIGSHCVIDIYTAQSRMSLSETNSVVITMGLGGTGMTRLTGEERVWITIEAEGCLINGTADCYEKQYDDFYTNDLFRPDEKKSWNPLNYPDKIPNYYEEVEISFPEKECRGLIQFNLHVIAENTDDVLELNLFYAKNDTHIAFDADSSADALNLLYE